MTLRITFEIVPYGEEANKFEIFRVDISNHGLIENKGFGHEICTYDAIFYRRNNETMQTQLGYSEYEAEQVLGGVLHDRRDGPHILVKKVLEKFEEDFQ